MGSRIVFGVNFRKAWSCMCIAGPKVQDIGTRYLRAVRMSRLMLAIRFWDPCAVTLPVALFILDAAILLWVYADDLIGKGLDLWVVLKLMVFASARVGEPRVCPSPCSWPHRGHGQPGRAQRDDGKLKASGSSYPAACFVPSVLCMALICGAVRCGSATRGWPAARHASFRALLYSVTRAKARAERPRRGVLQRHGRVLHPRGQTKHAGRHARNEVLIHDHRDPRGPKRSLVVQAEHVAG